MLVAVRKAPTEGNPRQERPPQGVPSLDASWGPFKGPSGGPDLTSANWISIVVVGEGHCLNVPSDPKL